MRISSAVLLFMIMLSLSACQGMPAQAPVSTPAVVIARTAPPLTPSPAAANPDAAASIAPPPPPELAAAGAQVGYAIQTLPATATGYTLDQVSVYTATQSVCLHYAPRDLQSQPELYLLQGPSAAALQPRAYPGLQPVTETVAIGGAAGPGVLAAGAVPPEDACADNNEWPRYILSWTFQGRQFLLYASVQVPAGGPGLTRLEMLQLAESLTGVVTHPAGELNPDHLRTVAEAEKLAGFDILEPAYLPPGVSFLYATYQDTPAPGVTLYYKIIHPQYGDKGRFFQITQQAQPEAPASALTCGEPPQPGCEVLHLGATPVIYNHNPGGTENLDWYAGGFSLSLFRMAGEPNKVYKDELIKVVESLK